MVDLRTNTLTSRRLVEDTCALVSIPSENPPGNEEAAARWTTARVSGFMEARLQGVSPGRANAIATFDFGPGPSLLLCTHLDVVPAETDAQRVPVVSGDRITGRGACDAKGALAAMVAACEALAGRPDGLTGRVTLAAVADEETGAAGALRFVHDGLRADAAVIGEPTGNVPIFASRGAVRLLIRFFGRSAHSSDPSRGVNAVYRAARFILGIEALNVELTARPGSPTCAATVVQGGTKLNMIPSECTVLVDRRLALGETSGDAILDVHRIVDEIRVDDPDVLWDWERAGVWLEPFSMSTSSVFGRHVLSATGRGPGPTFRGGTDAPHFIALGIPTVILGPGTIGQAHVPNEWVSISDLIEAAAQYEAVARAVLAAPAERLASF